MAMNDFWKGFGFAAGLAALAGAAVYATKKTLEYVADRREICGDDCDCDCGEYVDMPTDADEPFNCDGNCDECNDADICECATCEEQDCAHCPADSGETDADAVKAAEATEDAESDDTADDEAAADAEADADAKDDAE